jgi:hypothetical protein
MVVQHHAVAWLQFAGGAPFGLAGVAGETRHPQQPVIGSQTQTIAFRGLQPDHRLVGSLEEALGTAAVIGEASLSEAYRKFAQQTGIEGRKISILPQYILVPPGQRSVEARKQVTATTPSNTADVNPYAGRMQVIEEPRLIPASGQDPWFLAADPSRIDTVEYAYLDGQEGVFTETRMGFEVDGMEIKARHDFAAKAIDWRGLFKNAGAAPA